MLAGTIDAVFKNEQGEITIVDWKTNKGHIINADQIVQWPNGLKGIPKKNINKTETQSDVDLMTKHQFEKPTEPIKKDIEIPESITVSELAQKISMKSSELIKVMMKTLNKNPLNFSLNSPK